MKKTLLSLAILICFGFSISAQNKKCATMDNWERLKAKDANVEMRKQQLEIKTQEWIVNNAGQQKKAVITIPVVVHVLYNASIENVSDAQILSQITVLNEDFRLLNADSLTSPNPFALNAADCQIEFCMAMQDPAGNSTNGITRTLTDSTTFAGIGSEKFTASGGMDNWDPTKYLNLWVCNVGETDGTLGYATFPSDLSSDPDNDGVVIDYRAFGNIGTAGTGIFIGNGLGRTGSHEVGHWLNLSHIWGDAFCGDDFVSDTPLHETDNSDCPTYPWNQNNSCTPSSGANGEMFMNYMDYPDDACLVMFTDGQRDRMQAALATDRAAILTSQGCMVSGIENTFNALVDVNIYPNPSNGYFIIEVQSEVVTDINIEVVNVLGKRVFQLSVENISSLNNFRIDLKDEATGIYFVTITTSELTINKKMIVRE